MKMVLILGAGAVGKMTVGQELMKITDLRLFHSHMVIEPLLEIFGHFNGSAVEAVHTAIFQEFAKSDEYGMITTFIHDYDNSYRLSLITDIADIFKEVDAEIYCVELVASLDARLKRNATENRIKHKPSKQDIEWSNQRLRHEAENYRLEGKASELPFKNYMKIDNTNLEPNVVAQMIKERFLL